MLGFHLNSQNLPYPDPIHPMLVHFVIATVVFSFLCDGLGYFSRNHRLFEVSFWNLFVASGFVVLAVCFGEFEAGLAHPYDVAKPVLDFHTVTGWTISALVVALTAWRFVIRNQNPLKIPVAYLGTITTLVCLIAFQTLLGTRLVWVYGLHVEPVVQAMEQGTVATQVSHLPFAGHLGLNVGANGLPYEVPLHPQLVHFTLGLFIVAIAYDVLAILFPLEKPVFKFLGLTAIRQGFFDTGWYNMVAAVVITFFTVLVGFYELLLASFPVNQKSAWGLSAEATAFWHGAGGILLLTAIAGVAVWRGLQRFRWRKDNPREVHWSYAVIGLAFLGILFLQGTLGGQLGDEFGIHNTATNLIHQGQNPNQILK